jgi:hypothetical protein
MDFFTFVQVQFATKFFVVVYINEMMKKVNRDVKLNHHHVNVHFVVHIEEERSE